jgi:hypothetical protein
LEGAVRSGILRGDGMLDTLADMARRVWEAIRRAIGTVFAWLAAPFVRGGSWVYGRRWWIKGPILAVLALLIVSYGYFFVQTQRWTGFDTDYVASLSFAAASNPAGAETESLPEGEGEVRTCTPSGITEATAHLIDFNVNQNAWISSMLLYKMGFFGMPWDHTPFFDNKAAFQRGVNQAVRRTTVELVDTLGRIRGTSQVDQGLQDARGSMQFDEYTWYFGFSPFGPKTPTPSFYRSAIRDLQGFNQRLENCTAVFDARADNLVQFLDRIANDIGATSAILRERSENFNSGWFDTRADDRFWFAYGQLYGYYGILAGARHDFQEVIATRRLEPLWQAMEDQLISALRIQPAIVSNGREDGWIMPTHLATMGFYILRFRSNLVEVRQVLDR